MTVYRDINTCQTLSIKIEKEFQGDCWAIKKDDGTQLGVAEVVQMDVVGSEQKVWSVRIYMGGELPDDIIFLREPTWSQVDNSVVHYLQNRMDNVYDVAFEQTMDHFREG
jgi:hypothetical protein